eukprot:Nitzschia sp. Nitz4//scaffold29_size155292//55484//58816//NITZ4_002652-RA/size155292-processed-gene-0.12-mRNA-1//1//CDS//3329546430//2295//frame0
MIGSNAIISSLIAKALGSILEVNSRDMDSDILSLQKQVRLTNARLLPLKIRLSQTENGFVYLRLSGSIRELHISWSKTSKTEVFLTGARIQVSLVLEPLTSCDDDASLPSTCSGISDSKSKDFPSGETKRGSFLSAYWSSLWKDTQQLLRESETVNQVLQDFVNSLDINLRDIECCMDLPRDEQSASPPPNGVMAALESFELRVNSEQPDQTQFDLWSLHWQAHWEGLCLDFTQESSTIPVLEPMDFELSIRPSAGTRFRSLKYGREIVGRPSSQSVNSNRGFQVHICPTRIALILEIIGLCRGQSISKPSRENYTQYSEHQEYPGTLKLPHRYGSRVDYIWILFPFLCATAYSCIWDIREVKIPLFWMLRILVLLGTLLGSILLSLIYVVHKWKRESPELSQPMSKADNPAATLFKLEIPLLKCSLPRHVQVAFADISVLGELDGNRIHVASESCIVSGETPLCSLKLFASGLRVDSKLGAYLLNVDEISELYIPDFIQLLQPLACTSVRYENETLTIKANSIYGRKLSKSPSEYVSTMMKTSNSDHFGDFNPLTFFSNTRQRVQNTGRQINKGIHRRVRSGMQGIGEFTKLGGSGSGKEKNIDDVEWRKQTYRDQIAEAQRSQLVGLKEKAQKIDGMPLRTCRQGIRGYKKSFRGNEAVDYVLEKDLAQTRQEATKLLRDLQIHFNLFEDVKKNAKFADTETTVYRFVKEGSRRNWVVPPVTDPSKNSLVQDSTIPSPIPFQINLFIRDLTLISEENDTDVVAMVHSCELYTFPFDFAHANEFILFASKFENPWLSVNSIRIRAIYDPDLPREIHGLQVSVESLQATPGYSSDDWYDILGFVKSSENSSQKKKATKAAPYFLPFTYITSFQFQLNWRGVISVAKESYFNIEQFSGTSTTTSNDLITHFVFHVLGRAPGFLTKVNVLGVNVFEKTGLGTVLYAGASWIPFGAYLSVAGVAAYDGVQTIVQNGKEARNNPHDKYVPGDFFRGLVPTINKAGQRGARQRGKAPKGDTYDEEDRIPVDPLDFAVGATTSTAEYVYSNKARLIGTTVAGATVIAFSLAATPLAGIAVGVLTGAAVEAAVAKVEKEFSEESRDGNDEEVDQVLA